MKLTKEEVQQIRDSRGFKSDSDSHMLYCLADDNLSMRKALEFYGDEGNYNYNHFDGRKALVAKDNGAKAREILK